MTFPPENPINDVTSQPLSLREGLRPKPRRWGWLFVALLIWFYGGTAYLRWIMPAKFSGFRGSEPVVVVSPAADRILSSDFITIPLLVLSGLPVQLVSEIYLEARAATLGRFKTAEDYENTRTPLTLASPLIVSIAFFLLLKLMAYEIRTLSDVRKAKADLEEIRLRRAADTEHSGET